MIEVKTKLRRWGNSFGVVVPLDKVNNAGVKEGEEVTILISKTNRNVVDEIFGSLKGWKIDTQKVKDELRREEKESERRKWKNQKIIS